MNATLLPVLVKCCVLSKRQPRMCQPSHLTLPNGLLNADIKLARSFALPFSSLSLSLSTSLSLPLLLTLSLTLSLTCPLPLFHPLSVALSINLSCPVFPFFLVAVFLLRLSSITHPRSLFLQVLFIYGFSYGCSQHFSLLSLCSPIGCIMPLTLRIHPSCLPCCTSCQHHSTAWPTPLSLAWIGIGGAY